LHSWVGCTLRGAAERWLEVTQPLDLCEEGAEVPDGLAEPPLLEEVGVERGGAGDGEVGALREAGVLGLGRRQQREAELLRCRSRGPKPIEFRTEAPPKNARTRNVTEAKNRRNLPMKSTTRRPSEHLPVG
jgi:hypothetical protein